MADVAIQEHIVQWHPTILTKLALIEQRYINSYSTEIASRGGSEVAFKKGDFLARPVGCERDASRKCENEMERWFAKWRRDLDKAKQS